MASKTSPIPPFPMVPRSLYLPPMSSPPLAEGERTGGGTGGALRTPVDAAPAPPDEMREPKSTATAKSPMTFASARAFQSRRPSASPAGAAEAREGLREYGPAAPPAAGRQTAKKTRSAMLRAKVRMGSGARLHGR